MLGEVTKYFTRTFAFYLGQPEVGLWGSFDSYPDPWVCLVLSRF